MERAARSPQAELYARPEFAPLREMLVSREPLPAHNLDHPYFARRTSRSMLIDEMEALWAPIADHDDWSAFNTAMAEIEQMRQAYAPA